MLHGRWVLVVPVKDARRGKSRLADVLEPGARAAVAASTARRIGVIGTAGTIASGAYERAIRALVPDVEVVSRACPLFVPLVEEGWVEHDVTRRVAEEYLLPMLDAGVDAVVLGCTHYPLLKGPIGRVLEGVRLIDSAERTAAEVRCLLERERLLRTGESPAHRFLATDAPAQMLRLGQRFLGAAIEDVETLALPVG